MSLAAAIGMLLAATPGFQWEIPGLVSDVEIPGQIESGGVPVRLRAVIVKGNADQIADAILASFERQGLYVPTSKSFGEGLSEWQVTGFDPKTQVSYSVLFRPHSNGTLTLLLGEAKVGALLHKRGAPADFAPTFPGAKGVMRTNLEGLQLIGFTAKAEDKEVHAFYRQTLGSVGFEETGEGEFRRGGDLIRVQLTRQLGEVFVMVSKGR